MKKMKIKKILLVLGMAGMATVGNAQWAVTNINDPIYYPAYFGPTGIFTQLTGQMLNSVKASIDQVATLNEVSRKQAAQFQQDTDIRNRTAMGQAAIAAKNAQIFPTLQACAELSKKGIGSGASVAAARGGSARGAGKVAPVTKIAEGLTTEMAKASLPLANKREIGTCSAIDVNGKVGGCGSVGNYGGSDVVSSSDVSNLSIKGNTNNSAKIDKDKQEFANYTINPQGVDVANQYIANATLSNAPKMISKEKLTANPSYKSLYDGVMIKLNAAQQAMKDILALRIAPEELNNDSVAGQYWKSNATKYRTIFGLNAPTTPSIMDVITFNATNDYVGIPDDTAVNQEELLKALDKKMALSNYIASKQLAQQENTNILLAHLLTQQVTPSDLKEVNNQYQAIMNSPK